MGDGDGDGDNESDGGDMEEETSPEDNAPTEESEDEQSPPGNLRRVNPGE